MNDSLQTSSIKVGIIEFELKKIDEDHYIRSYRLLSDEANIFAFPSNGHYIFYGYADYSFLELYIDESTKYFRGEMIDWRFSESQNDREIEMITFKEIDRDKYLILEALNKSELKGS
ncbi:MAG: hypothetical protein KF803_15135 [Cyclobacteriaceae bacterium]|nr:hypothetical protein [Cyclobacteriaceae bacterium]